MIDLPEAVRGFTVAMAGEVSVSTIRWYQQRLTSFAAFVDVEFGGLRPAELSAVHVRAYRGHLVNRDLSLHSVHGHQRALRRFCGWLVDEGLLASNVALEVPLVHLPPNVPKALSDDDLRRFLERLPLESARDRAIVLFLADTGCRVGGLCGLTLDALDLANLCATVVEKGRRGRRVYYTKMTAQALGTYLDSRPAVNHGALFVSRTGTPLTENGVRLMLERIGRRAGVRGRCNAHSFRHAFARSFLRNGGNLAALGRLLGHTPGSPITAKYYAVWDDRELQEFHGRYSPLAGVNGNGDTRTVSPPLIKVKDS